MRGALMKLELAAPESDEFIEERRVAVGVAMELSPTARMRRIAPPLPPPERLG
jgi:hypothetical protein